MRYQKALAGIEWGLPIEIENKLNTSMEPFIGAAAGYQLEKSFLSLDTVYLAEIDNLSHMGISRISSGFRFFPVRIRKDNRLLAYGLIAGAAMDLKFPSADPVKFHFFAGISTSDTPAFNSK